MLVNEQLIIELMKGKFGVDINLNEVGEETLLLYHDELDEQVIPIDLVQLLPNPVTFHTYIYNEESEWIIGIALEAKTNNSLFLVCLKDGERVHYQLFD